MLVVPVLRVGIDTRRARPEPWRDAALVVALLLGCAIFSGVVNRSYPVREWLVWTYVRAWTGALVFGLACLSAGIGTLAVVLRRTLPLTEHFTLAFAVGVFAFFLEVFLAGLAGLLGTAFFLAGPAVLIAAGALPLWRLCRRTRRHLRALARAPRPARPFVERLLARALLVAGCAALALIYFEILTPDNVAYDARWYHLPLAEHYAAQHAIRPFPEGWFFGSYPHLASLLYTWAMLLPRARYFDRVELCAHLEFVIFLATLVGVSALARRMVRGGRMSFAWLAMFLFPEIFLYDSSLSCGADHIAALWAAPILLLLWRTLSTPSPVFGALLALAMAGALCTKFTAATLVAFPALAVTAWGAWRLLRPGPFERPAVLRTLAALGLTAVIATAPHWLKNLVWYGDPMYPVLRKHLSAHPLTPDFSVPLEQWFYPSDYHPARTWDGVKQTLRALFEYSFVPNDFVVFHRDVPIFGSLATLLLLSVPFLRRTRRIWLTVIAIHLGIFVWYSVHHFDRYLQTLLPWMAASVAAICRLLWQRRAPVRVALVALLGLQVVWGADVYFFPSHAMVGSAVKKAIDLVASGHAQNYRERFRAPFGVAPDMRSSLPGEAKVLIHEEHVHWGLERASVSDWQGTQAGISYVRAGSLRGVHDLLSRMGVTHLLWKTSASKGYDTLGGDLLFFSFAAFLGENPKAYGDATLAAMPRARPDRDMGSDLVAFLGCADTYADGFYRVSELVTADLEPQVRYRPPLSPVARDLPDAEARKVLDQASFAVIDPGCYPRLGAAAAESGLVRLASRHRLELYARPPVPAIDAPAAK